MFVPLVQLLLLLAVGVLSEDESQGLEDASDTIEELPTPAELRRPYTRGNSYDSYRENRKPIRRPSSSISKEFLASTYEKPKYEYVGRSDLSPDLGDLSASSSDQGSYASESGYGHSCSSSYVNASAVALLAFLFLLNLVQDIIQQVTADNRRKRDVESESESAALQFIHDGGMDALREGIPDIVIPLMVRLSDTNNTTCIARPLCEANSQLSQKYGPIGRVFATLLSNVASHAYSNRQEWAFDLAQEAAYKGRNEESCSMFELCFAKGS